MELEGLVAEVIRVAGALGLAAWERWVLVLVLALAIVLARRAVRSLPPLTVEPPPLEPPSGDGRPPDLPPAQVVTRDGTPVELGRTPEQIEADEREFGSGG